MVVKLIITIFIGVIHYFIWKFIVMWWIDEWHECHGWQDRKDNYKHDVKKPRKYIVTTTGCSSNYCVMCGSEIPEGDLVCTNCREEILGKDE